MREQKRESLYLGVNATAQIVTLTVTCDQCHQSRLRVRSLNRLEVEAAKAGWLCRKKPGEKDRDLCPACRGVSRDQPTVRQRGLFDPAEED